jgi:hypothetical protein
MRTTLTIDDDVLLAARERARREHRTVGDVVSDLARQSLMRSVREAPDVSESRHGFQPLPHRGVAVSNALIDQLREEEDL